MGVLSLFLVIAMIITLGIVPLWSLGVYLSKQEGKRELYIMEVIEGNPEVACDYCETWILGCSKCTSTFCCEGAYCEQAYDGFFDELETQEIKDLLIL